MSENQARTEAVDRALEILGEHYDNVQVFLSACEDDGTTVFSDRGQGNMFARIGHIHHWLENLGDSK